MQTADCRPGGKMQTEGKMQTADQGVKCRLRVECRLQIRAERQTANSRHFNCMVLPVPLSRAKQKQANLSNIQDNWSGTQATIPGVQTFTLISLNNVSGHNI